MVYDAASNGLAGGDRRTTSICCANTNRHPALAWFLAHRPDSRCPVWPPQWARVLLFQTSFEPIDPKLTMSTVTK